jgi:hypothetical protein
MQRLTGLRRGWTCGILDGFLRDRAFQLFLIKAGTDTTHVSLPFLTVMDAGDEFATGALVGSSKATLPSSNGRYADDVPSILSEQLILLKSTRYMLDQEIEGGHAGWIDVSAMRSKFYNIDAGSAKSTISTHHRLIKVKTHLNFISGQDTPQSEKRTIPSPRCSDHEVMTP